MIPSFWKFGFIAAGALALVALYGVWHHKVYQSGYDAAISDVAAENQGAINAAEDLKGKRRACIARGGAWSVVDGVCSVAE